MTQDQQRFRTWVARVGGEWLDRMNVRLGNMDGEVETGIPGKLYARQTDGQVVEVINTLMVPPIFDLRVRVGRSKNARSVWQIVEVLQDYPAPPDQGQIAYHHKQHEEQGGDRLALDRKQIIQLTVRVLDAAAFTIILFGGITRTASGTIKIETQILDLSGDVPTEGALFVGIETDDDGVATTNVGTGFATPGAGTVADFPLPVSGKYTRAWVLLYEGQSSLLDTHIVIPMPPDVAAAASSVPFALDDLTNVNAPTPTDGQVLAYNAAGSEWQAQSLPVRSLVMATGVTNPPEPLQNAEGTDWIYSTV